MRAPAPEPTPAPAPRSSPAPFGPADGELVPVARNRIDALGIAAQLATVVEHGELAEGVVVVGALADHGAVVELAIHPAEGGVDAFLRLVEINAEHGIAAWGYFVAAVLPETATPPFPPGAVPQLGEIAEIDAWCSDLGTEIVDWLLVVGDRGVSVFEVADVEWRWIDPPDETIPRSARLPRLAG